MSQTLSVPFADRINKQELLRILRFLFVGGLATLVDLMMTVFLVSFLGCDGLTGFLESVFLSHEGTGSGQPSEIHLFVEEYFEEMVSVISFMTAFGVSFFGHCRVTFRKKKSLSVFIKLITVSLAGLWLRTIIIFAMKSMLRWQGYLPVISAMLIVTVSTYIGSKYWVFRKAGDIDDNRLSNGMK